MCLDVFCFLFFVFLHATAAKPLQRVEVEMWQANHEGEYKNNTNHGFYELVTIYPGKYSTSADGRDLRPAHLQIKIKGRKGHTSLVTQM